MNKINNIFIIGLIVFLAGCSSPNVLSEKEKETQDAASDAVSGLLFENELDTLASYNVRKNGYVVIKFHESVKQNTYTNIVAQLRKTTGIRGVYAEQGGKEVCALR
jgi:hypothetical protein